jgi:hypothetical protein
MFGDGALDDDVLEDAHAAAAAAANVIERNDDGLIRGIGNRESEQPVSGRRETGDGKRELTANG